MDLISLRTFIAVSESASFSLAAERLFLSQPAVSKRISALEQELGRMLFDRTGRRIILTETGEALLPMARAILHQVEESRRVIRDLSGNIAGKLRFATSHHIGLHRISGVLREYSRRYPEVHLDIQFLDSENACRGVENGALELAVVTLPDKHPSPLELLELWLDPLIPICHHDHPLASAERVGLHRLAEHSAILPGPGTFTRRLIEEAFSGHNLEVGLTTNYLETNKMLIAVGLGWGILPASMLARESGLIALHTPLKLVRKLGLVSHPTRTPSNAAKAMIALLQQFADATKPQSS